jgi:hypothetical protein
MMLKWLFALVVLDVSRIKRRAAHQDEGRITTVNIAAGAI